MSVNFIDFIILFFTIIFIWQGYQTGFLGGVLNIISTVISLIITIVFYPNLGRFFSSQFGWSENVSVVIAFITLFVLSDIIFSIIAHKIYSRVSPLFKNLRKLLIWDKILGLIPSVLTGLFLVSLILLVFVILPINKNISGVINDSWWGKNVLTKALKYQPQIESVLNRLPYKNVAYLITPRPLSSELINLNLPEEIKLTEDPVSEKEMFDLVNKERKSQGLKLLIWDDQLMEVGRAHCLDMFERGYFSHYTPEGASPFDRMDKAGIDYKAAGENLAYAPNVNIAHQGLMTSTGHRENILRPEFGHLGVGVIDGGINGKMFCQEFKN